MSDGNILQTLKKTYPSSDSGNPSNCRLCGSGEEVTHRKYVLKKGNKQNKGLLAAAEAVYGRCLPRNE